MCHKPGKITQENWALRRGLNYQIVQGSDRVVEWLSTILKLNLKEKGYM